MPRVYKKARDTRMDLYAKLFLVLVLFLADEVGSGRATKIEGEAISAENVRGEAIWLTHGMGFI
jgi:hypothetical protein